MRNMSFALTTAQFKAQSIGIYFNEYIKANKDIKAKRLA